MKRIKTFEDFNKVNERGITNQVLIDEIKAEIAEAKKSGNIEKEKKLKNELFTLTDGTMTARKVNELSTAYANKAALASRDRKHDNDKVGTAKNIRQTSNLISYINPDFKKRLKLMGFDVTKNSYDEMTLFINIPDFGNIYIYVTPSNYSTELNPNDLDDKTLAKLNRAIKLTQQELKNAIPDENEL
jgi:hypothetical protein